MIACTPQQQMACSEEPCLWRGGRGIPRAGTFDGLTFRCFLLTLNSAAGCCRNAIGAVPQEVKLASKKDALLVPHSKQGIFISRKQKALTGGAGTCEG
jgi:hypothetical protein